MTNTSALSEKKPPLVDVFLKLSNGAFNNYVGKKRWVLRVSKKSMIGHVKARYLLLCKMSAIVNSRGVDGQNRVTFGPRSC